MVLLHFGALAALFVFSWQALLAAIGLWWISAGLGVGTGFSQTLNSSWLQDAKISGILSDPPAAH